MADTGIETSIPDQAPSALVTEIERTRDNLAKTIDEIADRVAPAQVAKRTADNIRERISQIDPRVGAGVGLAVVSAVSFLVWRRLRK